MRCGTFLKPLPQLYSSPVGDRFGATVAEYELMHATLQADDKLRWDLWSTGVGGSLTRSHTGRLWALNS
jgi:hypothetical protein